MRETEEFMAFGVKYKTTQFSAIEGFNILNNFSDLNPVSLFKNTFVFEKNNWEILNKDNINKYIVDKACAITPKTVLKFIVKYISDYNFGFLDNWRPVKIPARFLSNLDTVKLEGVDQITSTLIQEEVATLRELEEYYSIKDAYKLFDILMAKTLNKLLGQEEAEKEYKNKIK